MVSEDSEDIYSNIVSSLALVMAMCIDYVYPRSFSVCTSHNHVTCAYVLSPFFCKAMHK